MNDSLCVFLIGLALIWKLDARAQSNPLSREDSIALSKMVDRLVQKAVDKKMAKGPAEMSIGLRYGIWGRTSITNVDTMLIRTDLYDTATYSTTNAGFRRSKSFGLAFSFRPRRVPLYFDLGVDYEWMKTNDDSDDRRWDTTATGEDLQNWDMRYSDTLGLDYYIWCNYEYVMASGRVYVPLIGWTPGALILAFNKFGGKNSGWVTDDEWERAFSFGPLFGGGAAFNTNPRGLAYRSNNPDLGPDPQIQENLNNSLVGKTVFSWFYGGEIRWRYFAASAVWLRSNSDAIRTEANPYYFQEVRNIRRTDWLFSVRAILPLLPLTGKSHSPFVPADQ